MHLKQSFKINIAKPIRLKEKVEQFTFTSKDFNTPLLSIDRKKNFQNSVCYRRIEHCESGGFN